MRGLVAIAICVGVLAMDQLAQQPDALKRAATLLALVRPELAQAQSQSYEIANRILDLHLFELCDPDSLLPAGVWAVGNSTIPLSAGAAHGTSLQEMIIKVVLYSAAAPFFISMALVLWGLHINKAEMMDQG